MHRAIMSIIYGKSYKTLKRHLSRHGRTPDRYRERYNLPASYPVTAPAIGKSEQDLVWQFLSELSNEVTAQRV